MRLEESLNQDINLNYSTFEKIKKNLDSTRSHIVFETNSNVVSERQSSEIQKVLSRFEEWIRRREVYLDESRGSILLVVELDPGHDSEIVGQLANTTLPPETTYYLYGSRSDR